MLSRDVSKEGRVSVTPEHPTLFRDQSDLPMPIFQCLHDNTCWIQVCELVNISRCSYHVYCSLSITAFILQYR